MSPTFDSDPSPNNTIEEKAKEMLAAMANNIFENWITGAQEKKDKWLENAIREKEYRLHEILNTPEHRKFICDNYSLEDIQGLILYYKLHLSSKAFGLQEIYKKSPDVWNLICEKEKE